MIHFLFIIAISIINFYFLNNKKVFSTWYIYLRQHICSSSSLHQDASPALPYVSMASIFAFILSFGLGPGNVFLLRSLQGQRGVMPCCLMLLIHDHLVSGEGGVTNILNTELFTQTTRPAAYIISGVVSWLSFFTIGMVFPFILVSSHNRTFTFRAFSRHL